MTEITTASGFKTEGMNAAEAARAIERLCIFWDIPGLSGVSWNPAFPIVEKIGNKKGRYRSTLHNTGQSKQLNCLY